MLARFDFSVSIKAGFFCVRNLKLSFLFWFLKAYPTLAPISHHATTAKKGA